MNKQELQDAINQKQGWIDGIRETLQYADGQAYYNDCRRITEYQREISNLQHQIKVLDGEIEPVVHHPIIQTREQVAAEKARLAAEKEELRKAAEKEQAARSHAYVNRFRNKRAKVRGFYRRFYLKAIDYKLAQEIKADEGKDFRWDPMVKRWYMSVYLFSNQTYSPGGLIADYILAPTENALANEWSIKIKYELENLVENKRELTIKIHKTGNPSFWKGK